MEEHYHLSVAALIGAFLKACWEMEMPWPLRFLMFFTGYGVAVCLGPWGIEWMHVQSDEAYMALLFLTGFFGHDLLVLLSTYLKGSTLDSFLQFLKEKR